MQFDSILYVFIFLPLIILLYGRFFRSNLLLFVASLVFYGWHNPLILIPLLFSSVMDFMIGRKLHGEEDSSKRSRLLVLSVTMNLGLLCTLKYGTWLLTELDKVFAGSAFSETIPQYDFPLPPGISFYTFQTLSYTIDIYRRRFAPQGTFVDYLAYVSFFPQLIAGPIERASQLIPQFAKLGHQRLESSVVARAVFLISFGLFKKLVVADQMGDITELSSGGFAGAGILFSYAFAFQIYCDFSAYTDIARGSALFFGIQLSRNFLTPYLSLNPSDFWRRWHISLSTWLRDYLYIPLGGNQNGNLATLRNLLITMCLGGLWHGAGWTFLLWGVYHGCLLIFYRLIPLDTYLTKLFGRAGRILSVIVMYHLICVGWLLFRSESLTQATELAGTAIQLWGSPWPAEFARLFRLFLILATPIVVTDLAGYYFDSEFQDAFPALPRTLRIVILVLIYVSIILIGARQGSEFIYFQF